MSTHRVTVFRPYPFQTGQKIRIEGSKRGGDWEVVGVSGNKVSLRCPVSHKQFEWDNFCYIVQDEENAVCPREH